MKSEVIKKTLLNGLRLIHIKNKSNNIIIKATIKVGSQNETEENSGITHFLEHVLWQGTKTKNAEEIRSNLKDMNANFNAFTSFKTTNHFVSGPRRNYEKMLKLILDVIQNPAFDLKEIERERNVILDEYNRKSDDIYQILTDTIYQFIFKNHALGRSKIGTEENIKSFTSEQLIDYYNKYYVSNNIIISVIGNINNPEEVIEKYLTLESGALAEDKFIDPEPIINNEKIILNKSNLATHLGLAFLTSKKGHKDTAGINIIDYLLDFGKNINLCNAVRQKQGLTYNITAYNTIYSEVGVLIIKTTTPPDKVDIVINTIISEIKKLDEITNQELNFAKRKTITNLKKSGRWPIFLLEKELDKELFNVEETTEEEIEKIKSVTKEDIKRIAKEYFNNYLIVIIKPKS
ncbi:MAG: pitrilysin family protein [archaeon]|jgi:predicted Zn-dependent peptidase